ncbi:MAG: phosphodiester glycosidase family protein, partial [Cyanothece sp. SIO1E1]|nr:phosphodiester glycosidase family protein [Cyanothece sp. SIO1E1]
YVIQQGERLVDPRLNPRLINNPDLAPYLSQILNRSEFRRYDCGGNTHYDIAPHQAPAPADCQLVDALGAGPSLLPELTAVEEGFLDFANGEVVRDALGSRYPNARTAVGITSDGSVVWVMVAQKPEAPTQSGMSLADLIDFMKTLGVEKAMNLDGGSSSSLYYENQTWYGRVDAAGKPIQRPIKSVLLVKEKQ